ncbi:DUF3179 domain-containing (seleno)protein [Spectribacter hydrogenooxidans]|uniref:DUF3179 domain-containing (Seleno)protein n=1 Tax=Spectribacter hydrogenoxidans TaxID=3075608 RepID=A0ABU3BXL1_9GAMM|nr:DUF3179 domain-containing (seleno)protein [Salinisphaera sp. W335]MDT0634052.1 DUF3179 domain-containing (seleno)protein [Salinisphaera sp. W335]
MIRRPATQPGARGTLIAVLLISLLAACGEVREDPSLRGQILTLGTGSADAREAALDWIDAHWRPDYAAPLIDALPFAGDARTRGAMMDLLRRHTDAQPGDTPTDWQAWRRQAEPPLHPDYARIKASLLGLVERQLYQDLRDVEPAAFQHLQWTGLRRSDRPAPAARAGMTRPEEVALRDDELVIGLVLDGHARAYPRRLVADHIALRDRTTAGDALVIHDPLSGTTAAYRLRGDELIDLRDSVFLFKGDTVLHDAGSTSFWRALDGERLWPDPHGDTRQLTATPQVTTTWQAWRQLHPDTRVLEGDPDQTTFRRDKAAFRQYRADRRLARLAAPGPLAANQAVLGLTEDSDALAVTISADAGEAVRQVRLAGRTVSILRADRALRVYDTGSIRLSGGDAQGVWQDEQGRRWRQTESVLIGPEDRQLPRLPARETSWRTWSGSHPDSRVEP